MKTGNLFPNMFSSTISPGIETSTYRHNPLMTQSQYLHSQKDSYSQKIINTKVQNFNQKDEYQSIYDYGNNKSSRISEINLESPRVYNFQSLQSTLYKPINIYCSNPHQSDQFSENRSLGSSRVSQFSFSKPNELISNTLNNNRHIDRQKPVFCNTSPSKNFYNDYGSYSSPQKNIYINKFNYSSPMKNIPLMRQSMISQRSDSRSSNSIIKIPSVKLIEKPIFSYGTPQKIQQPRFSITFGNNSRNSNVFKSGIKRSLSGIPIMATKIFQQKKSIPKINFNYISPSKSEGNRQFKSLSKKEDLLNPAFKLIKKKKLNKMANPANVPQINSIQKVNKEVIDEYLPEFKLKNKKKLFCKKQIKKLDPSTQQKQRRDTFISCLQNLGQISEIRRQQKQQFTMTEFESSQQLTPSADVRYSKLIIAPLQPLKIVKRFRLIQGKMIQIKQQESVQQNKQNSYDKQFEKNDSSLTTAQDDEIVKKIKEDLGLNFGYQK